MSDLSNLDPATLAEVRRAAIAEIDLFGAADDPRLIEQLARAGRDCCGDGDVGGGMWRVGECGAFDGAGVIQSDN